MGAESISFELRGKASRSEIEKAFSDQRDNDAMHNGHADGYSGDFQTVRRVDFSHLGQVFESESEAFDFCLRKAEKWESVVAVYYAVGELQDKRGKVKRIKDKVIELQQRVKNLEAESLDSVRNKKGLYPCSACKSRLCAMHLRSEFCPLCGASLRKAKYAQKIAKAIEKLNKAKQQLDEAVRACTKSTGVNTLVAGWGAC